VTWTWLAILRKDLALELRTRQSIVAMVLFSVTVFVLFHFGLDRDELAPIDRTSIYYAKAAALFLYLVAFELIALPAFALLLLGPDLLDAFPELLAIVALANVGLAAVGALVAGIAAEARSRELVVPLMLLPLLVPVLIAAANATKPLLTRAAAPAELGKWLAVMGLFDIVFILLSVAVFDFLLED
jgi:heme exporter protein B